MQKRTWRIRNNGGIANNEQMPFKPWEINWVATLELDRRQVVRRARWPEMEDDKHGATMFFRAPATLVIGDFIEVRGDKRGAASTVKRCWYGVVTGISGPRITLEGGQDVGTQVMNRRDEILELEGKDREGLMARARKLLERLNTRERRQLFREMEIRC